MSSTTCTITHHLGSALNPNNTMIDRRKDCEKKIQSISPLLRPNSVVVDIVVILEPPENSLDFSSPMIAGFRVLNGYHGKDFLFRRIPDQHGNYLPRVIPLFRSSALTAIMKSLPEEDQHADFILCNTPAGRPNASVNFCTYCSCVDDNEKMTQRRETVRGMLNQVISFFHHRQLRQVWHEVVVHYHSLRSNELNAFATMSAYIDPNQMMVTHNDNANVGA
jgi:hypothetical protein